MFYLLVCREGEMFIKMSCAFLLLLLVVPSNSEMLKLWVQTDKFSTMMLTSSQPLDQCSVCKVINDTKQDCASNMKILPSQEFTLYFDCVELAKDFSVQIRRKIECNNSVCSPGQVSISDHLLSFFPREFLWELAAPADNIVELKFPEEGLNMVTEEEYCADGFKYVVTSTGADGKNQTQMYCRNGQISHLELPHQARVVLLLRAHQEPKTVIFTATPRAPKKKGRTITVIPDSNTAVIINSKTGSSSCKVCVGEGNSKACGSQRILSTPETTNVEFTCDNPQDSFNVEVNRDLDCIQTCDYGAMRAEISYFPGFDKIFTWDLKVLSSNNFQLDFPAPGLRQIQSSGGCPDKHTYTVIMYHRTGTVNLGTFCRNGTITCIQAPYKGRVMLEVPRDTALSSTEFIYSQATGPQLMAVNATLPRGQSSTEFFSPSIVPADFVMRWNFDVPPLHNFTVRFVDFTQPQCQSKAVKVTYQQDNKGPVEKSLTDEQPVNFQGDFGMSLSNCVKKSNSPALSLKFQVSVVRGGVPDLCTVDLQNNPGLSIKLEKKNPDSFCEMEMDSVVQEKITVLPGSKVVLSFLDCSKDELLLTTIQTIECLNLVSCPASGTLLNIPTLSSCLPVSRRRSVWDLRFSEQRALELSYPQGGLLQSLPGQECTNPLSLLLSEADGSSIGLFCQTANQGIINKLQFADNVTVAVDTDGVNQRKGRNSLALLSVSFTPEISDKLIYTITPLISDPTVVATPNWPGAVKSDSAMSWIVNVPEDYNAELYFSNVSLPNCKQGHTRVAVQELDSGVEKSFREDESLPNPIYLKKSFYLNMSNCDPEQGYFAILSKISLQKKSRQILSVILGVVGALLAVMLIALTVVCVVVRKKKQKMNNRSSIYMPRGVASLPGDVTFPQTQLDGESHLYDSIDDAMVYSGLLLKDNQNSRRPGHYNGHQVDTYRPFPGPVDTASANDRPEGGRGPEIETFRPFLPPSSTFVPSRPRTPLGPQNSVDFEDRRMVDNDFYTFKNPGDPNPIRLSREDPLPAPPTPDLDPETDPESESEVQYESEYEMAM